MITIKKLCEESIFCILLDLRGFSISHHYAVNKLRCLFKDLYKYRKGVPSILLNLLEGEAISGEYWWSMKYPSPWQREVRRFPPKICLIYLAGKHNFNLILTGLSFIYVMSHVPSESDRYIL